jgi:hypothetical protein
VNSPLKALANRLALALATGMILLYFSELAFWARPNAGTLPPEILPTYLAYSLAAYAFLTILAAFRVRNTHALFLAGALFGWLVEGVIVQTMVDDFPLGISFTGLAWHASITVMVGWYAVQRALAQQSLWPTLRLSVWIGLGYGIWAIGWWREAPPPTALPAFAAYVYGSTALLILAYAVAGRLGPAGFAPSRIERAAVAGLTAAYFVFITVPAQPRSLLILPPLAFLTVLALRRNALTETHGDLIPDLCVRKRTANLAGLVALPATASAVYGLTLSLNIRPATGAWVYAVTMPLGFILWIHSWVRCMRAPRPAPLAPASPLR